MRVGDIWCKDTRPIKGEFCHMFIVNINREWSDWRNREYFNVRYIMLGGDEHYSIVFERLDFTGSPYYKKVG